MPARRLVVLLALAAPGLLFSRPSLPVEVDLAGGSVEVTGLPADVLERLRSAELDRSGWKRLVAVTVHGRPDPPPIVGSYDIEGDSVRFRPMFPFREGMTYEVTLDASLLGEEVRALVSVPARDVAPTTVVERIYPTTDRLPENQLKLYVHFSAPMSGGDGLEHVRLLDAGGNEVVEPFLPLGEHFWDRDRTRYTIFFDPGRVKRGILPNEQMGRPLEAGERYRLVIDSGWRDAEGLPLAEDFEKPFVAIDADESALDPDTWTLSSPGPDTRDSLVVDFGEPLDRALLERALRIEDSSGNAVEGAGTAAEGETRWVFTPAGPWRRGRYRLVALGVLEDLAGNRIGRPFEVDVFESRGESSKRGEHRVPFDVR